MPRIYVSIGSNIDRHKHIMAALDALSTAFGGLSLSKVYQSEAVGFSGDDFFNLVAGFETDLSVAELIKILRKIEDDNGRLRSGPKFSSRTLDIDILTYGDAAGVIDGVKLPRNEIDKNAFVLLPMVDIAADELHPVSKKTYQQLWAEYDKAQQKLWSVEFEWRGKKISTAE